MKYLLLVTIPIFLGLMLFTGCGNSERVAAAGDTVSVNYTGSLQDSTVFDSSEGKNPLSFTIGVGQVITGFEDAVIGMKVGETKTVTLTPDQAYGYYRNDMIITIDRSKFSSGSTLTVGQKVQLQNSSGQTFSAIILEIGSTTVTVDANSELAGKTLIFKIELVSIN